MVCIFPSPPATPNFVFVGNGPAVTTVAPQGQRKQLQISPSINMSQVEYDMTYFFACFLPMNTVHGGGCLFQGQLEDMMHITPDLRDALCAVAALHRSRLAQSTTVTGKRLEPPDGALQLYGRSVKSVNRRIVCNTFAGDCSMLWTTFFLGLFEVRLNNVNKTSALLISLSLCVTQLEITGLRTSFMEHAQSCASSNPQVFQAKISTVHILAPSFSRLGFSRFHAP